MKKGILKTTLVLSSMAQLLLTLGCEEESQFFDTNDTVDAGSEADKVTPECVRYVDPDIAEPGDALSWDKAVTTVEEAAELLPDDNCEIWVKGALETESDTFLSPANFPNTKVVDGFSGSEVSRPELARVSPISQNTPNRFSINKSKSQEGRTLTKHRDLSEKQESGPIAADEMDSDPDWTTSEERYFNENQFRTAVNCDLRDCTYNEINAPELWISGSHGNTHFNYNNGGRNYITIGNAPDDYTQFRTEASSHEIMRLKQNGDVNIDGSTFYVDDSRNRVGIGDSTPDAKLDVAGDIWGNKGYNTTSFFGNTAVGHCGGHSNQACFTHQSLAGSNFSYALIQNHLGETFVGAADGQSIRFSEGGQQRMRIWGDGDVEIDGSTLFVQDDTNRVGIGTRNPEHRLSVNGTIQAEEIIVEMVNADYVFNDNYDLWSLEDVESYIKEESHLPGVPSTADVDAHGVSIGAHQAILLQKVEELTLHLIEQNKRLSAQEKEIAQLKGNKASN